MHPLFDILDICSGIYPFLDIEGQELFCAYVPHVQEYTKQWATVSQKRFWVRNNSGFYQHPDIEIELIEPLQKSQGIFQSNEIRDKLYVILYQDYLEYKCSGLVNYTVYVDTNQEAWVYVSISDAPIAPTDFSSYGPLPQGTEYRSYETGTSIIYKEHL